MEKDLKSLPQNDLSVIGEDGTGVSGGQRTRIALARAVYSRAHIYLLDDPLSSLDRKVAENIYEFCLKGLLADRIVLLTTHAYRYVKRADTIVKLHSGQIVAHGKFDDVKRELLDAIDVEDEALQPPDSIEDDLNSEKEDKIKQNENLSVHHSRNFKEDRETGSVSLKVYMRYFCKGASVMIILLMVLFFYSGQGKKFNFEH